MKRHTLLITTALLAIAIVSDASAQSTRSRFRTRAGNISPCSAGFRGFSPRKSATASRIPPAPPVPARSYGSGARPHSQTSAKSRSNSLDVIGLDETGRMDRSGHLTKHYASAQGTIKAGPIGGTALNAPKPYTPHATAHKGPFKFYGE